MRQYLAIYIRKPSVIYDFAPTTLQFLFIFWTVYPDSFQGTVRSDYDDDYMEGSGLPTTSDEGDQEKWVLSSYR